MIQQVKTALRMSKNNSFYDEELLGLIKAGVEDLKVVGATFRVDTISSSGVVVDYNITDPLVARAVTTYCRVNFGSPDDYDRMKTSYDEQKAQLRCNSKYMIDKDGGC